MVMVWHAQPSQELHERRDGLHQEADRYLHKYANYLEVELHWNRFAGQWYASRASYHALPSMSESVG